MSKTKKIISLLLTVALIMTIATVAIVSASAATTVYFKNEAPADWAEVYVYCWGDSEISPWPGNPCTDLGNGVWSAEIPDGVTGIIFNNNNNKSQTPDLDNPGDGYIAVLTGDEGVDGYGNQSLAAVWQEYADAPTPTGGNDTPTSNVPVVGDTIKVYFSNDNDWSGTISAYVWDADSVEYLGGWPGAACNDEGDGVWSIEIPVACTNVIFSGTGGQTNNLDNPGTTKIAKLVGEGEENEFGQQTTDFAWYDYNGSDVTSTPITTDPVTTAPITTAPVTTAPATSAPATTVAPATSAPATTATSADGTGITVAGTAYEAAVGTTVTYKVDLTAARLFENVQAVVTYDSSKLKLTRVTSDDPDVEDWEVEGPLRCPNLDGVIFNAGAENIVKFNASKVAGYNFKDGANLVNLEFTVLDSSATTVAITIEEMTIKGGDESYFENGVQVITDGVTVSEYLVVETAPVTTAPVTTAPVTSAPATSAPATTVAPATSAPATTVAPATSTPATTVAPVTTAAPTVPGPATDPTSTQGTTTGTDSDVVSTGAAAYIYVVFAVIAMVSCAVVVLRKKVNG